MNHDPHPPPPPPPPSHPPPPPLPLQHPQHLHHRQQEQQQWLRVEQYHRMSSPSEEDEYEHFYNHEKDASSLRPVGKVAASTTTITTTTTTRTAATTAFETTTTTLPKNDAQSHHIPEDKDPPRIVAIYREWVERQLLECSSGVSCDSGLLQCSSSNSVHNPTTTTTTTIRMNDRRRRRLLLSSLAQAIERLAEVSLEHYHHHHGDVFVDVVPFLEQALRKAVSLATAATTTDASKIMNPNQTTNQSSTIAADSSETKTRLQHRRRRHHRRRYHRRNKTIHTTTTTNHYQKMSHAYYCTSSSSSSSSSVPDHKKKKKNRKSNTAAGTPTAVVATKVVTACLPCTVWVSVARVLMRYREEDVYAAEALIREALLLCPLQDRIPALDTLEEIGQLWEDQETANKKEEQEKAQQNDVHDEKDPHDGHPDDRSNQCSSSSSRRQGLDRAMTCYEIVLLQRSQLYGPTHVLVAKSLTHVARVMEATGNLEGSVDLYRAAQAIYTSNVLALTNECTYIMEEDDVQSLLELFPTALEQGRYEEVVVYLSKVIELIEHQEDEEANKVQQERDHDDDDNNDNNPMQPKEFSGCDGVGTANAWKTPFPNCTSTSIAKNKSLSPRKAERCETKKKRIEIDKTYIFYNLSRAYIGLSDYVSATVCLLEAVKYKGQVSQDAILALLQRVEFLQRGAQEMQRNQRNQSSRGDDRKNRAMVHNSSSGSFTGSMSSYIKTLSRHGQHSPSPIRKTDTPMTSDLSYESREQDDDNSDGSQESELEGTTFSGRRSQTSISHSVTPSSTSNVQSNAFAPSKAVFMTDPLQDTMDEVLLHSDPLRNRTATAASESELVGTRIEMPDNNAVLVSYVESQNIGDDLSFDSLNNANHQVCTRKNHFPGFRLRKSSTTGTHRMSRIKRPAESTTTEPLLPSLSNSSQRSKSLAKTLTSSFRRQRRNGNGYHSYIADDTIEESLTPSSSEKEEPLPFIDAKSPSSLLPCEEDYHSILEGPVDFVILRSNSLDSCGVSEISINPEDFPQSSVINNDDTKHEWSWKVSTGEVAWWFPTAYVSKAVEAAEGFLSARSIHSKVVSTPLEYISEDDDDDEDEEEDIDGSMKDKESSGDLPSSLGVVGNEPKTFTFDKGVVDRRTRAKAVEDAKSEAAKSKSMSFHGVSETSVYSADHRHRPSEELKMEIVRVSHILDDQRARYGEMHPETASTLFTLAVLYSRCGAAAPAIEYAAEALSMHKAAGNFADALQTIHFLADEYLAQCQYSTALIFYTEALNIGRSHYGEISDQAAMALNCIGSVQARQNEFLTAMESHQDALRIFYALYGKDTKHPLISQTLCQIGAMYYRERNSFSKIQGQGMTQEQYTTFVEAGMLETIGRAHEDRGSYKLALSFFEEKLQLMEAGGPVTDAGGLEDVASTLNSLGMLNSRAGFYTEAIDYYQKALKIQHTVGYDTVQFATTRVLIGAVYFQLGEWHKALKLHEEALVALRRELGAEHQTVAAVLYQRGVVHAALCEYDTALNLFKQALGIQTRLLGVDQPATLRTRREIANVDAEVSKSSAGRALEELDDVLACQQLIHGDRHPNIAETLHSIGRAYARAGDQASALSILEECYYMRTEFLGRDHPQQAVTLHDLCQLHFQRGHFTKTLQLLDIVIGILRESLSDHHVEIALALSTKARCVLEVDSGNVDRAQAMFREALQIAESAVGPKHPIVATILVHASDVQKRQCHFDAARDSIDQAIAMYRQFNVSEEYPSLLDALEKRRSLQRDEEVLFV